MVHDEIEAIVRGLHNDPFRVLGPHRTGEDGVTEIRAFLPHAMRASVLLDGQSLPMERLHSHGFFSAKHPGPVDRYRLRVEPHHGEPFDVEDPYRFPPILTEFEIYLHGEGTNYESYRTLGAHLATVDGISGVRFAVWAPNAEIVSVIGDFNQWDTRRHPMRLRTGGIWELFIPELGHGATYKYYVRSRFREYQQMKADPYAFASETPPKSASLVWDLGGYEWSDAEWMSARGKHSWLKEPIAIYEVHLESWLRDPQGQPLTYRDLAATLLEYVKRMGYTHIELLPIQEHPFSGSWGYQVTGYYAPTSRFGTPQDFMYFVDRCHQAGVGVIVDWVPGHFPKDAHGLAYFDGTALYEHADPRKGEHRDWGTLIFNYGRNEVKTFLISNALFWLEHYHIDGLRVDAVASMLYLDYSRKAGEWIPNQHGGNENLEAIDFLKRFNELVHKVPGAITLAEESTAWPGVSKPTYLNGLGFTMKWNMGWMHDMLHYFGQDPVHRRYHHHNITFSMIYAFTENFVLPISHDEVVHGKGSLIGRMPGDAWQKFANVRAFLAYMYGHPGKKLLFMGQDIGQWSEWSHSGAVDWSLLNYDSHRKLQALVMALNQMYKAEPALYQIDFHYSGFEWVDFHDAEHSVIAFLRRTEMPEDTLLFCCNFTPVPRRNYRFGVPAAGFYEEILNTDADMFGGSNVGNGGFVVSEPVQQHGRMDSISVTLPPLGVVVFKRR